MSPGQPYNGSMAQRTQSRRSARTKPVRQSVTIPASLVGEVRRVAKERKVTLGRALVSLAEQGIRADSEAKEKLKAAYDRFMKERKPGPESEAGRDLVRAIFGADAITADDHAKDTVR
jgi:hypothetical protein